MQSFIWDKYLNSLHLGVAVGAGELEEAETKQLAETRKELVKVNAALRDVNEENETLKRRIAALEGRDSYA